MFSSSLAISQSVTTAAPHHAYVTLAHMKTYKSVPIVMQTGTKLMGPLKLILSISQSFPASEQCLRTLPMQ
jgi:hypothetical protein